MSMIQRRWPLIAVMGICLALFATRTASAFQGNYYLDSLSKPPPSTPDPPSAPSSVPLPPAPEERSYLESLASSPAISTTPTSTNTKSGFESRSQASFGESIAPENESVQNDSNQVAKDPPSPQRSVFGDAAFYLNRLAAAQYQNPASSSSASKSKETDDSSGASPPPFPSTNIPYTAAAPEYQNPASRSATERKERTDSSGTPPPPPPFPSTNIPYGGVPAARQYENPASGGATERKETEDFPSTNIPYGGAPPTASLADSDSSSSSSPPQQEDGYGSTTMPFPTSGDGTIPTSEAASSDAPTLSPFQPLTVNDGTNGNASSTSTFPIKGDAFASRSPGLRIPPPATSENVPFSTPIEDPPLKVPRRPDVPPPMRRLLSPTQSYLNFAEPQPEASSSLKVEPFLGKGAVSPESSEQLFLAGDMEDDVPSSRKPPMPKGTTSKSSFAATKKKTPPLGIMQYPLDAFIDAQLQMMQMDNEPYKRLLKKSKAYWKKQIRLMGTGGVKISGSMKGERVAPDLDTVGMTERIMNSIPSEAQATGAGGRTTWQAFQRAEENWARLKEYMPSKDDPVPPPFVKQDSDPKDSSLQPVGKLELQLEKENKLDNDIVDVGGRLGIFFSAAFQQAEENWARLKEYMPSKDDLVPPPFVKQDRDPKDSSLQPLKKLELQLKKDNKLDYDIVVAGGTLGIFVAAALQLQGHHVCVIEAGKIRGREQEWNVSMEELLALKKLGILSQEDIDEAVTSEFDGCRSVFKNREIKVEGGYVDNGIGFECFTEGVLNLGVSPAILLKLVSKTFQSIGGIIKEDTCIEGITVSTDYGACVDVDAEDEPITARLVIDAMGSNSPITRQERYGTKPDGVCVVVGSCAGGYDPETNVVGDIIYTNLPIQRKGKNGQVQYFWESFPVGIGRNGKNPGTSDVKTTYLYTFIDANKRRPTLESIMEDYWRLLPQYQPSINNPESDLDIRRVMFAFYPTYRQSPLQSQFSRILAVGDASGIQSPLRFGGFGALTRHLERITTAVTEAIDLGVENHKENLMLINPYTPNLSASWMLQKAMSVRLGRPFIDKRFINRLMATNFEAMHTQGDRAIKPFLQDVVRFDALVGRLGRSFVSDPTFMPLIVEWVGVPTLVDWAGHVGRMGVYAGIDNFVTPWLRPIADATIRDGEKRYRLHRHMDAWRYGSGNDYDVKAIPKK